MTYDVFIYALLGGILIGLSATLLLALEGRVLGVSGILGGLLNRTSSERPWRWSFLLGMLAAGFIIYRLWPQSIGTSPASPDLLIAAGLLVGFGTRLGGGCTSGHGVCGISRGSLRSVVATLIFMSSAFLTVYLVYR